MEREQMRLMKKLFVLTAMMLLFSHVTMSPFNSLIVKAASNTQKIPKTTFQTTDNLNMRSGPGVKDRIIFTIPKKNKVTATAIKDDRYNVSYTYKLQGKNVTKTGWVHKNYLKEYYQYTNMSKTYFETLKATNLRSTADTKKKVVSKIAKGNVVYSTQKVVNSIGQTWYRVSVGGKNYYVSSGDVNKTALQSITQTKYLAKNETDLYSSYSTTSTKLTKIPKGTLVTSKQRIGKWYKVTFNGKTGYIAIENLVKFVSPSEEKIGQGTYFTTSKSDLKQYAHTLSNTLGSIQQGVKIVPTHKTSNGYLKVKYDGKTGYVLSSTLKIVEDTEPPRDDSSKPTDENGEQKLEGTKFKVIDKLNLREKASTTSTILDTIPKGEVVSPTHKTSNNWYKIVYKSKIGYVSGDFLEELKAVEPPKVESPTEEQNKEEPPKVEAPKEEPPSEIITEVGIPEKTFWVKADLNLRKNADTTFNSLLIIPKNIIVIPTHKTSNNWYKVKYNGKIGYVSGTYLQEVITGNPMNNRSGYQFIDLRTQSPVAAAQINNYIANYEKSSGKKSVLSGKGQVFINSGNKYGVNALYLAAHAIHESAFGTSSLSFGKYNFFGFGAFDATPYVGAYRFPDIDSSIDFIASEMKSTYLNPSNWKYKGAILGYSTKTLSNARVDDLSEGMNFYYATDLNWGQKIASHMEKILAYDKAYYEKASINTTVPVRPSTPAGSDVFPSDVIAISNSTLYLHSKKGGSDYVSSIGKGKSFAILEKTNDYWVKVKYDGNVYWTNNIRFDVYKSYLTVQNLGRVNVSELNIRPEANTNNNPVGQLKLNDYVSIVLKKDGSLTMDSTKTWYQINLTDGKTGWVSSQYITRELK
ncbi:SH3 domain-containing protein [Bacillus sp. FJAT-49732]|uniref:SH3 domain-containing protein n=1 Tax=Lederbergia citrisecunda TaxID=2833583 RepID=A0A942TNL1_9BACI|nr:SH3 domain-containing protein [Lederbergia citrisecunda]MBS4200618.1 SH3 domain-containing protein [Lederbergia citrisecunda]